MGVVVQRGNATTLDVLARDVDTGFAALVRAHSGAVYSTALRLSGSRSTAEDIAQDAFVRAYRALRRFDADRIRALEARPWLLTITLNVWRNHVRAANAPAASRRAEHHLGSARSWSGAGRRRRSRRRGPFPGAPAG